MSVKPVDLNQNIEGGLDRRIFIRGLGSVSLGLLFATVGGCESCLSQIENRPTRRRLRTGSADVDAAIATYRNAVAQMQALPANNPRSWDAQAAIHGTVAGGFNHCQHGTAHFFSWHRAYLLYFEQICQELTGDPTFGLPYWNWNQNPQMHPEFLDPSSPLFHPRNSTTVGNHPAFSDGTLDGIFSDGNFFSFGNQLEGSPHNMAHVLVGGDMVTGGSPQDPVFWAHHCMVDYCWAKWNIELGNDNTNDAGWLGTTWNHFVDRNGNPITVSAGATILMPLLAYQYESSTIGSNARTRAVEDFQKLKKRLKEGADIRFDVESRLAIAEQVTVDLASPFSKETQVLPGDFATLIESDSVSERIFVSVDWAQLPSANDFFVRVFLNLPTANLETPTDDPHYAGSFAFFGTHHEGHEGHGKTDFLVHVTDTLQRLRAAGEAPAGQPLSIQLVAVPVSDEDARVSGELVLNNLDLVVTPMLVRSE